MERDVVIVAGFGFRDRAGVDSLENALGRTGRAPDRLATLDSKATTPAFAAFVARWDLPLTLVSADALAAQDTATRSAASQDAHNAGSVAEAAALAAAGPGARLLTRRVISDDRMATCALAIRDTP